MTRLPQKHLTFKFLTWFHSPAHSGANLSLILSDVKKRSVSSVPGPLLVKFALSTCQSWPLMSEK